MELKVNKVTSTKSILTFDNYDLPFCQPVDTEEAAENLGEHLTGDSIKHSPYELLMRKNETCKVLCTKTLDLKKNSLPKLMSRITQDYHLNWMVDTLPAAVLASDKSVSYSKGIPIGAVSTVGPQQANNIYLYNHHHITLLYHTPGAEEDGSRIVGFFVTPRSMLHVWEDGVLTTCPPDTGLPENGPTHPWMLLSTRPNGESTLNVTWTYDVEWKESPIRWASRWDVYLSMDNKYSSDIHWFSILNSTIIALFLTGMVAMIMIRAIYKDFSRYNRVATDEEKAEDKEETGWKLVHADVFRPPTNWPLLFAVFVGVGCQVVGMTVLTLFFAAAGFLSPANRGSLMIALLLLFLFMGAFGGYEAARTHKMLNGVSYQKCTLLVGFGFPGIIFSIIFILNLFVWADGASNAIPFLSMFTVLLLWFAVSVPLVFFGAFYGFKQEKITFPVATGSIPRQIPPQQWYFSSAFVYTVGGILPFGAVFVELYFILASVWLDQYYYVFGFLLLVFVLLALTCAEIAIVLIYFQLCAEDYRWWWRSALVPGSSGVYVFGYSVYYLATKLDIDDGTSKFLYLGYMFLVSFLFFLLTGAIGHLSTLWFTRKIYGAIKVD